MKPTTKCACNNTPGEQTDKYSTPDAETLRQEVDSLNDLGPQEDLAPEPDTIEQ